MGIPAKKVARNRILGLEKAISKQPGAMFGDNRMCPLSHSFGDGIYVREIFMPAGMVIVSKIHKKEHPFFVLKGRCIVTTDDGTVEIQAPYWGMTKAGTKRALLILEDTTWVTCHASKSRDPKRIEREIIAKSFDELEKGKRSKLCHSQR
jgi:quercetin dioxygenase-like cupin family protein